VIGGIVVNLIAIIPAAAWGFYWCWKNHKVKADFGSSAKIFLAAAAIAGVITFMFVEFVVLPYLLALIGVVLIYLAIFMVAAPLLGAVNQADIDNFKLLSSGLSLSLNFKFPTAPNEETLQI
jgi:hypothetical protein